MDRNGEREKISYPGEGSNRSTILKPPVARPIDLLQIVCYCFFWCSLLEIALSTEVPFSKQRINKVYIYDLVNLWKD